MSNVNNQYKQRCINKEMREEKGKKKRKKEKD